MKKINKRIIYVYIFHTGNSVRVLETLKNIHHTESQTDYQEASILTSNKMVQTESSVSNIVTEDNNMEIRTLDECLAVYKTQVKLFTY